MVAVYHQCHGLTGGRKRQQNQAEVLAYTYSASGFTQADSGVLKVFGEASANTDAIQARRTVVAVRQAAGDM